MNILVSSNRRLALRMLREQLNLNRFIVCQILTEHLRMRQVCVEMVPKTLTIEQKDIQKTNV